MPWSLLDILSALPVYALVLFRLTGLMLTAPLFASSVIPVRIRVALTVTVAAMIFPLVAPSAPTNVTLLMVAVGGVAELMIGATIGLALAVLFLGTEVGGMLVGQQGGLALGQVFDPTQNRQTTVVAQIYTIVWTLIFLIIGGHRATMAALLDTYEVIPLLTFRFDESYMLMLVEMLTAAFVMAIRLAGPVLIALFMLGTAMGFLSRTMPQFNILTIGFALRGMVAIGVAGFALIACEDLFVDAIWNGLELVRASFGLDGAVGGGTS
ncbi:MAG: flagellar biosynthetic protein FliR [Planctomycetes bacterium]|nr:flagellar biosynthetic protein FliR [Planctomycetota bacterium]MCH8966472.1 flagellar biosynthetic protein FliR [Planctomycetota bacterium]